MAWRAELTTPISKPFGSTAIVVQVKYYDTAATGVTLHHRTFNFKAGLTGAQMQAEIVREGQAAKAAHDRAVQLAGNNPVGTTIPIP